MDKESFIGAFDKWYERNKDILNERVSDKRIKQKHHHICDLGYAVHILV